MKCTLKTNIVDNNGKFYPFGSIVEESDIPMNLRKSKYMTRGIVHTPRMGVMELTEIGEPREDREAFSPMKELTLDQLDDGEAEEGAEEAEEEVTVGKRVSRR